MFLQLYTRAVLKKFQDIFENTHYSLPEQLLETAANKNTSSNLPKLPVIGVFRIGWEIDTVNFTYEQAFQGTTNLRNVTNSEGKYVKLKRYPIIISFQVEVISDKQKTTDEISEELFLIITSFPRVCFEVTEPFIFTFNESNLVFQGVTDSSEVSSFKELGRLYRTIFDFNLQGAYIYSSTEWEQVGEVKIDLAAIVQGLPLE